MAKTDLNEAINLAQHACVDCDGGGFITEPTGPADCPNLNMHQAVARIADIDAQEVICNACGHPDADHVPLGCGSAMLKCEICSAEGALA